MTRCTRHLDRALSLLSLAAVTCLSDLGARAPLHSEVSRWRARLRWAKAAVGKGHGGRGCVGRVCGERVYRRASLWWAR